MMVGTGFEVGHALPLQRSTWGRSRPANAPSSERRNVETTLDTAGLTAPDGAWASCVTAAADLS